MHVATHLYFKSYPFVRLYDTATAVVVEARLEAEGHGRDRSYSTAALVVQRKVALNVG